MILVTGATGRLGARIVRLLRQARLEVRCLVRPGSQYFWLNDTGAAYFFGDLRDPASLQRAVAGCTHVIHAAQVQVETHDNHHTVTTLEGARALFEAASEAGVRHLVMVSCAGAEAGWPAAAFDCLGQAEAALTASGLSHSILRCGVFAGTFADAARRAQAGQAAVLLGNPTATVRPLARQDASLFAVAALDHPELRGRAVTLVGPEALTVQEALDRACAVAGVSGARVLSGPAAKLAIRAAGLAGRRWRNALTRQSLMLSRPVEADTAALAQRLGLPLTGFDDAVRSSLDTARPWEDPEARHTQVVHRQFQATVYEPGVTPWSELPEGPRRLDG
ncbi:MAG: NAD(P)H-binding protein [Alphaproteobacteria bacterium]|nr:NAD(P)H-binding protein [Alphaproteobacteria bacterium]